MHPRTEAFERLGGRHDVRVLEPSPPAVNEPPWFADDPVALDGADPASVVRPVPGGPTWDDLARDDPDLASWCAARWLGAWRPLVAITDASAFSTTRRSWHQLAEHVLAAARWHATTKIGLRFTHDGIGTPFYGADRQARIAGTELVVVDDGVEQAQEITTLRAAAALVDVPLGAPTEVFTPTTPVEPDAALPVNGEAAARLGDWYGFACSALEALRAETDPAAAPSRVQLWPEHLDLAIDLGDEAGGGRGTFGASPGDDEHPEPYLYVTHWGDMPDHRYWDDPAFGGASLAYGRLLAAADQREAALEFFRRGRGLLTGR